MNLRPSVFYSLFLSAMVLIGSSACDNRLRPEVDNKDLPAPSLDSTSAEETTLNVTTQEPPAPEALMSSVHLEGKVNMLLPKDFGPLSQELLDKKYPSNQRPTEVVGNSDGSVNVAFNHTQTPVAMKELPVVLPIMEQNMEKASPGLSWERKELVEINGRSFILLEFVSPSEDVPVYNRLLLTSLDTRLLMIGFNCPSEYQLLWDEQVAKMLESVVVNGD